MPQINGQDIDKRHMKDPIVSEYLGQITYIDKRIKEIEMEKSRINVARIVYANSLIRYVNDHPLDDQ
jgi:hypothetical protein